MLWNSSAVLVLAVCHINQVPQGCSGPSGHLNESKAQVNTTSTPKYLCGYRPMCIINWSLALDFTSHLLLLALEDGITLDYSVTQKPYRLQLFPVFVFTINQDVHSWQWEFGKLPSHTSHQYPQNRGGLTGDQPTVTAHQGLSSMAGATSTRKVSKQICTCHSCQKIQDAKPYTQLWCSGWWHIEPFYKTLMVIV